MAVVVLDRCKFFSREFLVVDSDPSSSTGVSAALDSLAEGPSGILYQKTGAGNTAWTAVGNPQLLTAQSKSAAYAIQTTDDVIFCDTSGGAFNLTLPSPTVIKIYRVIDVTGSFQANNLTLLQNAAEKISGVAGSLALQAPWGFYQIISNGTDWFVGG
jgi:hypothetical protein